MANAHFEGRNGEDKNDPYGWKRFEERQERLDNIYKRIYLGMSAGELGMCLAYGLLSVVQTLQGRPDVGLSSAAVYALAAKLSWETFILTLPSNMPESKKTLRYILFNKE